MSAIAEYIGVVYSGDGYVQGIMPSSADSGDGGGGDDGGGDGEEPDLSGKIKDVIALYGEWSDEIGAWFADAYEQSQVEGASRALVPIPPALPPALIGGIIGLPAAPILIPITISITLISKIAQGWLSYRKVAQFQEFLTVFRKAFISTRLSTPGESILALVVDALEKILDDGLLTDSDSESVGDAVRDVLKDILAALQITVNGEKQGFATTQHSDLQDLLYKDETIDFGGVHIYPHSKLITEP